MKTKSQQIAQQEFTYLTRKVIFQLVANEIDDGAGVNGCGGWKQTKFAVISFSTMNDRDEWFLLLNQLF